MFTTVFSLALSTENGNSDGAVTFSLIIHFVIILSFISLPFFH